MPTLLSIEALEADRLFVEKQRDAVVDNPWGTARLMWDNRLKDINKRIEELRTSKSSAASVALIFDGLPVIGQGDIRLDFSTDALASYQKIISAHLAANEGDVSAKGKVPGSSRSKLFIRDIVRGSMGFILEEISPQADMFESPLKKAVEDTTKLLTLLSNGSEQEFDDTIENAQPRLVAAVQKFTKVLKEAGATTKIVGDDARTALTLADIGRLSDRFNDVEIQEEILRVPGILRGILPESHQFELQTADEDHKTIKGSVSDDLALKYVADQAFKEQLLLKPVIAHIKLTQTLRNGKVVKEQRILENLEPRLQGPDLLSMSE